MDNQESKIGPIIGIIIVVIVLIIGALYFWGEKLNSQKVEVQNPTVSSVDDPMINDSPTDTKITTLKSQDSSDDLTSISNDLNATVLDSVDADLQKASQ